jgi:hypothetical protein
MPYTDLPAKNPSAIIDYAVDWTTWMAAGDSLATVTWTVPSGITKVSDTTDGAKCIIWLSGGTVGQNYTLTCSIVTTDGRTDSRQIVIKVKQK